MILKQPENEISEFLLTEINFLNTTNNLFKQIVEKSNINMIK